MNPVGSPGGPGRMEALGENVKLAMSGIANKGMMLGRAVKQLGSDTAQAISDVYNRIMHPDKGTIAQMDKAQEAMQNSLNDPMLTPQQEVDIRKKMVETQIKEFETKLESASNLSDTAKTMLENALSNAKEKYERIDEKSPEDASHILFKLGLDLEKAIALVPKR
jgi:hypothetical protein